MIVGLDSDDHKTKIVREARLGVINLDFCSLYQEFDNYEHTAMYEMQISESTESKTQLKLHNHLISLFRSPPKLMVKGDPIRIMNRLSNIKDIVHSCLDGKEVEASVIDEFFSRHSKQKSSLIAGSINGELKTNSKLYEVENLTLRETNWKATSVLQHFKGRFLYFLNAVCYDFSIVQFLRKWLEGGEESSNLEILRLYLSGKSTFDKTNIGKEFDLKPWDPSRRPRKYTYTRPDYSPWTMDLSDYWDIERKKDGKVASLSIASYHFLFYVWK